MREDGASKVARKVFNAFVEGELGQMALFRGIPTKQLKQVVPLFSLEEHPANTAIFKQGAPGDKVYIVMHGSVNIVKVGAASAPHTKPAPRCAMARTMPARCNARFVDDAPQQPVHVVSACAGCQAHPYACGGAGAGSHLSDGATRVWRDGHARPLTARRQRHRSLRLQTARAAL